MTLPIFSLKSAINNQQSTEPFFDIAGEITYAQNNKDLQKLDEIKHKIEIVGG